MPSVFFLREYRAALLLVVLLPVLAVAEPFGHRLAASMDVVVMLLEVCCPHTEQVGLVVVFVVYVAAMVGMFVVLFSCRLFDLCADLLLLVVWLLLSIRGLPWLCAPFLPLLRIL